MHYTRVSDAQQVCIVSRQRRWPGLHLIHLLIFVSLSIPLSLCVCNFTVYECHPCYGLTLVGSWVVLTSTV